MGTAAVLKKNEKSQQWFDRSPCSFAL